MIHRLVGLFFFLFSYTEYALSNQVYLERFMAYLHWSQHLPSTPDAQFQAFINKDAPLSNKLRSRWLYELARQKNWGLFLQDYRPSKDTTLQCYAQLATYHQNPNGSLPKQTKQLWLSGHSQPKACDELFTLLLNKHLINDELIHQRIRLALAENNISLARYLLKQLTPAQLNAAEQLNLIRRDPRQIEHLTISPLHGELYLYGLKQMVTRDPKHVVNYWSHPRSKQIMNERQQQTFLAHMALYQALRNEPDATVWFNQIKPQYYNDTLLEWGIRYALMHRQWHRVIDLIQYKQDKNEPCWQYWLARAKAAIGQREEASIIYHQIANKRNYYGFLASSRLKQPPRLESEPIINNPHNLLIYKPITDQIKNCHQLKLACASQLLNDFNSELPKTEKSALAYWVATELHWPGKAISLGNDPELNNQLPLRFPITYYRFIKQHAQTYHLPQAFIYAIIRQESAFNEQITSSAGANGLMQIMPFTAKLVAKQTHIAYHQPQQLFLPQTNIHIGTAYLNQLASRFQNHPILIAAAYNAGPRQAFHWLQNHPPKDIDIWIETLPWKETRNYLKNITAFYIVYQYRLHEKLDMSAVLQRFS